MVVASNQNVGLYRNGLGDFGPKRRFFKGQALGGRRDKRRKKVA
jgi:hypothetical protein